MWVARAMNKAIVTGAVALGALVAAMVTVASRDAAVPDEPVPAVKAPSADMSGTPANPSMPERIISSESTPYARAESPDIALGAPKAVGAPRARRAPPDLTRIDDRLSDPSHAPVIAALHTDSLTWANAEAEDFEAMMGDTFSVRTDGGEMVDLVIAQVVPGPVDPNRPDILPRSRGVTLVLSSVGGDDTPFTMLGDQQVQVFHHSLGDAAVMLGVYPTEDGRREIEIMLN